jgi:hypothetical protein
MGGMFGASNNITGFGNGNTNPEGFGVQNETLDTGFGNQSKYTTNVFGGGFRCQNTSSGGGFGGGGFGNQPPQVQDASSAFGPGAII